MRILLEQPTRLIAEHDAVARLAESQAWLSSFKWGLTAQSDICVDADIDIDSQTYEVQVVYPDLFPDVPARVQPRNREHWSGHQYGNGGALCLEWGPDNWTSEVTGAMLLESAFRLLSAELPGPGRQHEVSSRHAETEGQRLRPYTHRMVIAAELGIALAAIGDAGSIAIASRTLLSEDAAVAVVSPRKGGTDQAAPSLVAALETVDWNSFSRDGWAIVDSRLSEIPSSVDHPSLKTFLQEFELWPWTDEDERHSRFLLIAVPGRTARGFSLGFGTLSEYQPVTFQQVEAPRRPRSHTSLTTKSVAVIGLGSVGSKLAVSLARAGVGRFVLVDEDILAPHNLVRHELDWREIGLHKVTATAKAIKLVAPEAVVQTSRLRLAGQENSMLASAILEKVGACDLVVDATASPAVLALLSAVCSRRKAPLVWGELFAGGYGGMMARSRPGQEADGLTVRNGINQYFGTLPSPPEVISKNYDAVSGNQVLIASDADVMQLAAAMTQFSLDSLTAPAESAYPYSAYLLGFRAGWIFTAPFHTIPLEVAVAQPLNDIEPAPNSSDPRMKEIVQGITEAINAVSMPSA